jgi:hypothetical protein
LAFVFRSPAICFHFTPLPSLHTFAVLYCRW